MFKEKFIELISAFAIWLSVYFAPVYPLLLIIGFFIMADTLVGIRAAKVNGKLGHKVSKMYRPAIDKFIGYGVGILVAHVIEKQFLPDFPALKIISGFLVYIELRSINENIETITGINLFKVIIDKMKPTAKN